MDNQRNPDGTFKSGHNKLGGMMKGSKQRNSLRVQNALCAMLADEVEKERFAKGLEELYYDDRKGYYQVMASLMKTAAINNEVEGKNETRTAIDSKLDQLMRSVTNRTE